MSELPSERFLAIYWIPFVGIGNPIQKVYLPLTDILNYKLSNGSPQASLVYLFAAKLTGSVDNFVPPYIDIDDVLLKEMTPQRGETKSNVQKLQDAGIKVVLSVLGNTNMGWSNIPSGKQSDFAAWVKSNIIDKYSLDGIDIDDEQSQLPQESQNFVNTIAYLRNGLGDSLISKALWNDNSYFTIPVSGSLPYAGSYFAGLLNFGTTMYYGYDGNEQKDLIKQYHDFKDSNGNRVGMDYNKLCIGVQAGPLPPCGSWMTSIGETLELAQWSVEPQSISKPTPPILGMMLFTFTQDIQQWDECPQNQQQYKWPNPGDHRWQQALTLGMWGEFTVQSKLGWQNTGVNITSSGNVMLTYLSGKWTSNPNDSGGRLFDANGNPEYVANQPCYPLNGVNEGALIGRLGANGRPFLIGNGPTRVHEDQTGQLELCINDDLDGCYGAGLSDNIGSVTIKIS